MERVGVIGARSLPECYKGKVFEVVEYLVAKGYQINSGGACGADQFALEALVSLEACAKGVLFSAWTYIQGFPKAVQSSVNTFLLSNGQINWGLVSPKACRPSVVAGLLERNERLVTDSDGLVAFLHGESRGSSRTICSACAKGRKVVVFLCGGQASLPNPKTGKWYPLQCSGLWEGAYLYKNA